MFLLILKDLILDIFISSIVSIFLLVLFIYKWIVIVATLITWVNPDPNNIIIRYLRLLTEPVFEKIRRFVPSIFNGIDLSPIYLLLFILFLETFLIKAFVQ